MRVIFAGTPDFAVVCLQALIDADFEIVTVLCQADKKAGRGLKLHQPPVKQAALAHNIPVRQVPHLDEAVCKELIDLKADAMVVVAYGLILPKILVDNVVCINVHASLLPRWRGAAPIQRAIEAGDAQSGVSIMRMDEHLDTGAVYAEEATPLAPDETARSLHDRLAELGSKALVEVLYNLAVIDPVEQSKDGVNYAAKITTKQAFLDFYTTDAVTLERRIRAFSAAPGCWFIAQGARYKVGSAHIASIPALQAGKIQVMKEALVIGCAQGGLSITSIQAPGKRMVPIKDFINGMAHTLPAYVDA